MLNERCEKHESVAFESFVVYNLAKDVGRFKTINIERLVPKVSL